MKLLAYTIGGQKIGIDILTWDDAMLSGNTAFMAIADTGSTPSDYVDISSVSYWDQFGGITTLTPAEIKNEIIKLIPDTPTQQEFEILEGYMNVGINSMTNIDDGVTLGSVLGNGTYLTGVTDTKLALTGGTTTDLVVNDITGETGKFEGDYRINGKLWVETIRRVKQITNQMMVRVDQNSGLGGGNIAGMVILNPTGATTGSTVPFYIVGTNKDGILVAGWSGDTKPVTRIYGTEYQLATSLAESTTASDTPVTKTTLTTTDLPSGTYKVSVGWIGNGSASQSDIIFDVTLNDTPQGTNATMNIEPKDANSHFPYVRIFYLSLSGVNDIALRYWSEDTNTVTISDATIELIRVE